MQFLFCLVGEANEDDQEDLGLKDTGHDKQSGLPVVEPSRVDVHPCPGVVP